MLTIAMLDTEYSEPGTEVTFVWGEEDDGSLKPTVEKHLQIEMRTTVHPLPYSKVAREEYTGGSWRKSQ